MAGGEEHEIPDSGGVFTFGRSRFADNQPSHFFIRNDPVIDISCGDEHTALVCQNGRIFVFGNNEHGQLGLGHTRPVTKPSCIKQLKPKTSRLVSCGKGHTLVATACGRLFSFGANSDGQLGLGDTLERHEPVEVTLPEGTKVAAIAAGCLHSAMLTGDGEAYTWGCNSDGQCGQSSSDQILLPTKLIFHLPVTSISCGYYHTAFTSEEGIFTMGESDSGKLGLTENHQETQSAPQRVELSGKFISVTCGGSHTLALAENGEVFGFGSNFSGQLGMGNIAVVPTATSIPFSKSIKQIACGESHSAFLTEDGELLTCGDTRHGKLCVETTTGTSLCIPTLVEPLMHLEVTQVRCGGCHTMLLAKAKQVPDSDVVHLSKVSTLPPLKVRRQSTQSPSPPSHSEVETVVAPREHSASIKSDQCNGDNKSNTESNIAVEEEEIIITRSTHESDIYTEIENYTIEEVVEPLNTKPVPATSRSRLRKLLDALRLTRKTSKDQGDSKEDAFLRRDSGIGNQNASKACSIL